MYSQIVQLTVIYRFFINNDKYNDIMPSLGGTNGRKAAYYIFYRKRRAMINPISQDNNAYSYISCMHQLCNFLKNKLSHAVQLSILVWQIQNMPIPSPPHPHNVRYTGIGYFSNSSATIQNSLQNNYLSASSPLCMLFQHAKLYIFF